jgi:hypothetical protein
MPRSRNKLYVCKSCKVTFKGKAATPCPNCASNDTERALGKRDTSPDEETSEPAVATQEEGSAQPAIPSPPKAPPPPAFKAAPAKGGGGALTPEMLRSVKLKKVVRPPRPLPGPKDSPIPLGVRVLASAVQNPRVPSVRLGRPWPKNGPMYYLPTAASWSLADELHAIASGKTNAAHDNFNTAYYNHSRELPTRNNPFQRAKVAYYEYGWWTMVPQNIWYSWKTSAGQPAPQAVSNRLGGFLKDDGGKTNLERIIIAATGEVFYTPDHYTTFYRYSAKLMDWTLYRSPESRYGTGEPDWDASIYYG